jgi:hypothetical protein
MNNKTLSSLLKAKNDFKCKDNLEELSKDLKQAFLAEWSNTPDNVKTSSFLNFGNIKNKETGKIERGLALKSQNDLISNILWAAFGDSKVPEQVLEYYPDLKNEEWNQIIRIAQVILSSFECEIE